MKTKRKKWNARELFLMVEKVLKENGVYPEDLLDYSATGSGSEMILSEEFDIVPRIVHGANEGIYMNIMLETNDNARVFSSHKPSIRLGSYKTLSTDKDSYIKMATLGAEFVYALDKYVSSHIDEFNWTGYDMSLFNGEGKPAGKMWVFKHDRAVEQANRFLAEMDEGSYAVLRNNETEKEETIRGTAA